MSVCVRCLCVCVKVGEKTEIIRFRCQKSVFCQTRLRRIRFFCLKSCQINVKMTGSVTGSSTNTHRGVPSAAASHSSAGRSLTPLSELKVMFLHKSTTTQTKASASPGTAVGLISVSINTPPHVISSLCAIKVAKLAPPPLSLTGGPTGTRWDVMSSSRIGFPKPPRFQPHARPLTVQANR